MALFSVQYDYDDRTALRDEVRPTHRAYLLGLAESGLLRGSGPFTDGEPGAQLVFDVDDRAGLTEVLAADPFAQAGLIAKTTVRTWNLIIGPWAKA